MRKISSSFVSCIVRMINCQSQGAARLSNANLTHVAEGRKGNIGSHEVHCACVR